MNRKTVLGVAIILLAFVLGGCGSSVKEGTVIAKRFEDARYYQVWDSCKTSELHYVYGYYLGKYQLHWETQCHGGYVTRYDDADYMIEITKCKETGTQGVSSDGSSDYKKTCHSAWKKILGNTWGSLKVGDYYKKVKKNGA